MALYNDLLGIPSYSGGPATAYVGGNALYPSGGATSAGYGGEDFSTINSSAPLAFGTGAAGGLPGMAPVESPMGSGAGGSPVAPGAGATAFQNYLNNFGFQREFDLGSDAIRNNMASRRLLGSGATLKALQRYGLGLRDQYRTNYLNLLGNQQAAGLNAAGAAAGATTNYTGQVINAENSRASAIGNAALAGAANNTNFLGTAISAAALLSDERAKTDIEKVGEFNDGLGIYRYRYKGDGRPQIGVMAQEVARKRPDALGPRTREGLRTVNYLQLARAA